MFIYNIFNNYCLHNIIIRFYYSKIKFVSEIKCVNDSTLMLMENRKLLKRVVNAMIC